MSCINVESKVPGLEEKQLYQQSQIFHQRCLKKKNLQLLIRHLIKMSSRMARGCLCTTKHNVNFSEVFFCLWLKFQAAKPWPLQRTSSHRLNLQVAMGRGPHWQLVEQALKAIADLLSTPGAPAEPRPLSPFCIPSLPKPLLFLLEELAQHVSVPKIFPITRFSVLWLI